MAPHSSKEGNNGEKKTNFNNKPVSTPIWIPWSHNCLNSPPLAIVIITDTLLRDSISSINQPHTYRDIQPLHHIISICPIISLTRSKIPLLLQEGNYGGFGAVSVRVCLCIKHVPSVASLLVCCYCLCLLRLWGSVVCFLSHNPHLRFWRAVWSLSRVTHRPLGAKATWHELGKEKKEVTGDLHPLHLIITMLNLYWLL